MTTIGIFDTGVGGVQFSKDLLNVHPKYNVTVVHDRTNLPYGSRTETEIQKLTENAIQPLLNCDVIVLACNTATAYAINYLREKYPNNVFVGFEPAIKVAAQLTKTSRIAVLATPATLKSPRYQALKSAHAADLFIFEPQVKTLAHQIETRDVDWVSLKTLINNLVSQSVDCIVLGCTHYHLIKNTIQEFSGPEVIVITPTHAVISQIEKLT